MYVDIVISNIFNLNKHFLFYFIFPDMTPLLGGGRKSCCIIYYLFITSLPNVGIININLNLGFIETIWNATQL